MIPIYKICRAAEWVAAAEAGKYVGSADDRRDGFIHFSTASQLPGTAEKFFRDSPGLVLVAIDPERLGPDLRWEPSRGGALFPHLYGALAMTAAIWVKPLPLGTDGVPIIPDRIA